MHTSSAIRSSHLEGRARLTSAPARGSASSTAARARVVVSARAGADREVRFRRSRYRWGPAFWHARLSHGRPAGPHGGICRTVLDATKKGAGDGGRRTVTATDAPWLTQGATQGRCTVAMHRGRVRQPLGELSHRPSCGGRRRLISGGGGLGGRGPPRPVVGGLGGARAGGVLEHHHRGVAAAETDVEHGRERPGLARVLRRPGGAARPRHLKNAGRVVGRRRRSRLGGPGRQRLAARVGGGLWRRFWTSSSTSTSTSFRVPGLVCSFPRLDVDGVVISPGRGPRSAF